MSARPTGTGCRLYIITPERLDLGSFPDALARALDAGDVFAVQLRLKTADDGTWKRAIEALLPVCRSPGTALLLNDRPDLVVATGCDGAHVGQTDMPARAARSVMGPGLTAPTTSRSAPSSRPPRSRSPPSRTPKSCASGPRRAPRLPLRSEASPRPTSPRWCGRAPISSRSSAACGAIPTAPLPEFARSTPRSSSRRRSETRAPASNHGSRGHEDEPVVRRHAQRLPQRLLE